MKPVTLLKSLMLTATMLFVANALAYDDDKKKELCRKPKVQEFTLPEYIEPDKKEAAPEAEFSFVVSGWANPKKFKLNAKGKDIPFTVESSETFHKVRAKLLPEFTGQTIRISVRIPAILDCYTTQGWLVKVADKPKIGAPAEVTPPSVSTSPTTPEGAAKPATNMPQPIQNIQNATQKPAAAPAASQ